MTINIVNVKLILGGATNRRPITGVDSNLDDDYNLKFPSDASKESPDEKVEG